MAKEKNKEVRLLTDHDINGIKYPCNSCLLLNPTTANELEELGLADSSPEAVTYVKSEGAEVVDLTQLVLATADSETVATEETVTA